MAKMQTKPVKAEASKTPSSKTDLVEVTNFDNTAEVTGVGTKGPSGDAVKGKSRSHLREMAPALSGRGTPGAASCGRKDADQRPN